MSDRNLNLIRTFAVVVGVVVTLLTCGIGLGRVQSNVSHLHEKVVQYEAVKKDVSSIKEDFAFLKGTVIAKLESQGSAIQRIELKVNDLTRAD